MDKLTQFRITATGLYDCEKGIEGYAADGTYGFGWKSTYGKELKAKQKSKKEIENAIGIKPNGDIAYRDDEVGVRDYYTKEEIDAMLKIKGGN